MFSQVVQDAINEQINNELSAWYSYLGMSTYCERQNFTGCARWLRIQSQEEYGHGLRLLDFLIARNGTVKLKAVPEPSVQFKSIAAVFEQALQQEQQVSAADRQSVRVGAQGKSLRGAGAVAMVHHRASGRRKDGARDRGQIPPGARRSGVAIGPRPRVGRPRRGRRQRARQSRSERRRG